MCLLSRNGRMCVISVYIIISCIHLGNLYVAALVYVCCRSAVLVTSFIPRAFLFHHAPHNIRALVDALCRDGVCEISHDQMIHEVMSNDIYNHFSLSVRITMCSVMKWSAHTWTTLTLIPTLSLRKLFSVSLSTV